MLFSPLPIGDHFTPFHTATLSISVVPSSVKSPPAYTNPSGPMASPYTCGKAAFCSPAAMAPHVDPFHIATPLMATPPRSVKYPPT